MLDKGTERRVRMPLSTVGVLFISTGHQSDAVKGIRNHALIYFITQLHSGTFDPPIMKKSSVHSKAVLYYDIIYCRPCHGMLLPLILSCEVQENEWTGRQ